MLPAVLPDVETREIKSKQFYFRDKQIQHIKEKPVVFFYQDPSRRHEFIQQLLRILVNDFLVVDVSVDLSLKVDHDFLHTPERKPAAQQPHVAVITFQDGILQLGRHAQRDFVGDKRIAVTVAARPESDTKKPVIFPLGQIHLETFRKGNNNCRDGNIKYLFQKPTKTDRLVIRSWLGLVNKAGLAHLLQQQINLSEIAFADGPLKVSEYTQHMTG